MKVVYQAGVNEKLLRDFIKKHNVRDKLFSKLSMFVPWKDRETNYAPAVASKCGFQVFEGDYSVTNSASHIKNYIEGTIERLGFAPDLYYLHRIDPSAAS